ncbi:MAG TPA: universal stress protein [Acidimicrobiales bacterium]|jgi:nucleotide-binding universal stress UspA family protein|nr:universal stress protein [Acidimicrobiales bacterium]
MYKMIAVGTDGSETADRAVEAAADLARSWGSELHVITSFKASSPGLAQVTGAALVDTGVSHAVVEEAARQVGARAIDTWGSGLFAQAHAVHGDAVDAILDTAALLNADLIVVGSKGMRGARRYLGSVPNSVAHGAHCAVLVVKTA